MRSSVFRLLFVIVPLTGLDCESRGASVSAQMVPPTITTPPPSPSRPSPPATPTGVRFAMPPGHLDVASFVSRARAEAASQHRRVLVYVGAEWCPPCMAFHTAVIAHRLDREFPDLTLLEFDYDIDEAQLRAAGYNSRMVPYFTVPATDGRATSAHIEGAIRDAESVDEIIPRLHALLGDSTSAQN